MDAGVRTRFKYQVRRIAIWQSREMATQSVSDGLSAGR